MTKNLFGDSSKVSDHVVETIMFDIKRYEGRKYWTKFGFHSLLVLGTGYSLFPATKLLIANLTDSGFFSYFSLIFSDGNNIGSYISDLVLTLANSLPVTACIIVLGALIIFINSFNKIYEYKKLLQYQQ